MKDFSSMEAIRTGIMELYRSNPRVHIDITLTTPKLRLENDVVTITGVYRNLFQIEEYTAQAPRRHALPYSEVLIRRIVIHELDAE